MATWTPHQGTRVYVLYIYSTDQRQGVMLLRFNRGTIPRSSLALAVVAPVRTAVGAYVDQICCFTRVHVLCA